jgi:hypothetical protein
MHTYSVFCRSDTDLMQNTHRLYCRILADSMHTLSRENQCHSNAAARLLGPASGGGHKPLIPRLFAREGEAAAQEGEAAAREDEAAALESKTAALDGDAAALKSEAARRESEAVAREGEATARGGNISDPANAYVHVSEAHTTHILIDICVCI